MNFKEQTSIFLEAYNSEILEEGINNNSASKRLKSIIDKAESKASEKGVSKALATLRKGYEEFSRLENAYKSASSAERRELKDEYKELQSKYSYQLKRLHMPKGAAAAIIAAALAVTGAGYGVNKYQEKQGIERMNELMNKTNSYYNAQKKYDDAVRSEIKRDYISKNEDFRKMEKKNEEYYKRNNVIGYAKKLYNDGVISSKNRKSLESYDFYDYKNALMSACSVDGYMTEENGKKFAKEYLKFLESKAPMNYKNIINMARKYIAGPELHKYDKMMTEAGRWEKW